MRNSRSSVNPKLSTVSQAERLYRYCIGTLRQMSNRTARRRWSPGRAAHPATAIAAITTPAKPSPTISPARKASQTSLSGGRIRYDAAPAETVLLKEKTWPAIDRLFVAYLGSLEPALASGAGWFTAITVAVGGLAAINVFGVRGASSPG